MGDVRYHRISVYLDDAALRARIKAGAAHSGVSVSEYCLEAVRARLAEDGLIPASRESARKAGQAMDRARRRIGPIGIPVSELIREGRR